MFFPPISIYALCEWMVLYRRNTSVERVLGIADIGCAGLAAFGVVANVSEALMAEGAARYAVYLLVLAYWRVYSCLPWLVRVVSAKINPCRRELYL